MKTNVLELGDSVGNSTVGSSRGEGGAGIGVDEGMEVSVGRAVIVTVVVGVEETASTLKLGMKTSNATNAAMLARIHRIVSRLGKRKKERSKNVLACHDVEITHCWCL